MQFSPQANTLSKASYILKCTFGVLFIVVGLDKFTNILTKWVTYVDVDIAAVLPVSTGFFMLFVGIFEILIGIIVLNQTRIGAYVIAVWLLLITINLLYGGLYFDIAARDIVLAISAFVLAKLTTEIVESEKYLNDRIMKITMEIREKHPELSEFLDEMPITIPNEKHPKVNAKSLREYYESLKNILRKSDPNRRT